MKRLLEMKFKNGFHMIEVGRFVALTSRYTQTIELSYQNKIVSGKSIMGLLCLAIPYNATFEVTVTDGEEKECVLNEIEVFFNQ